MIDMAPEDKADHLMTEMYYYFSSGQRSDESDKLVYDKFVAIFKRLDCLEKLEAKLITSMNHSRG